VVNSGGMATESESGVTPLTSILCFKMDVVHQAMIFGSQVWALPGVCPY